MGTGPRGARVGLTFVAEGDGEFSSIGVTSAARPSRRQGRWVPGSQPPTVSAKQFELPTGNHPTVSLAAGQVIEDVYPAGLGVHQHIAGSATVTIKEVHSYRPAFIAQRRGADHAKEYRDSQRAPDDHPSYPPKNRR